jgi:hypothetical protein
MLLGLIQLEPIVGLQYFIERTTLEILLMEPGTA